MTTLSRTTTSHREDVFELHTGDRMNREEFHRAYEKTPDGFKAELIGGIVYVASPLTRKHGIPHISLGAALVVYKAETPGVEAGDNITVQLGYDAEPQPDLFLRILPEYGGQSRNSKGDDYVDGAPEFVAEIALSSRAIDLHAKRNDYVRNGVLEYVVVCVRERELRWFDLREDRELSLDQDKICRVRSFPGLWIDADALLAGDDARLLKTLHRGVATPDHAEFVARLAAARKSRDVGVNIMIAFFELLESRRLLSTVTLGAAEAKLASDVSTLAADAKPAKTSLIAAAKVFKTDLQALHLKSGPLKSALVGAVASANSKIEADVSHIIAAGFKDGEHVVSDVLHITLFNADNAAKIATYQKRLAADLKTLQTLETPLITKLGSDVGGAVTQINGAVQAIITANSSDQALATDWTNLSSVFQSAKQTLVPDLTNVISDLAALSTAA